MSRSSRSHSDSQRDASFSKASGGKVCLAFASSDWQTRILAWVCCNSRSFRIMLSPFRPAPAIPVHRAAGAFLLLAVTVGRHLAPWRSARPRPIAQSLQAVLVEAADPVADVVPAHRNQD